MISVTAYHELALVGYIALGLRKVSLGGRQMIFKHRPVHAARSGGMAGGASGGTQISPGSPLRMFHLSWIKLIKSASSFSMWFLVQLYEPLSAKNKDPTLTLKAATPFGWGITGSAKVHLP
jgi:hypothetical protein